MCREDGNTDYDSDDGQHTTVSDRFEGTRGVGEPNCSAV